MPNEIIMLPNIIIMQFNKKIFERCNSILKCWLIITFYLVLVNQDIQYYPEFIAFRIHFKYDGFILILNVNYIPVALAE